MLKRTQHAAIYADFIVASTVHIISDKPIFLISKRELAATKFNSNVSKGLF